MVPAMDDESRNHAKGIVLSRGACLLLALAGLMGAAGVILAAAASHGAEARLLANASMMCLAHAPVIVGLVALEDRMRLALTAAALLIVGTSIFSGDLLLRSLGLPVIAYSAPAGGLVMIVGWLSVCVGAVLSLRSKRFH
jgi:uncharacterized membrane protein YgdD (TMEM256/DUF423 family)